MLELMWCFPRVVHLMMIVSGSRLMGRPLVPSAAVEAAGVAATDVEEVAEELAALVADEEAGVAAETAGKANEAAEALASAASSASAVSHCFCPLSPKQGWSSALALQTLPKPIDSVLVYAASYS